MRSAAGGCPRRAHLGVVEAGPVLSSTARKGPNSLGAGRPNSSVKKVADSSRSFAATMVWLNVIAISIQSTTGSRIATTMHYGGVTTSRSLTGPGSRCGHPLSRMPTAVRADRIRSRGAALHVLASASQTSARPVASSPRSSTSAVRPPGSSSCGKMEADRDVGWRRPQPHIIDFGYCLGRPWWGQGFMSEAAQLLLDNAQRDTTVYRVRRTATSTTRLRRGSWNAAGSPSKAGWRVTPCFRTSARNRRTVCCSPRR